MHSTGSGIDGYGHQKQLAQRAHKMDAVTISQ